MRCDDCRIADRPTAGGARSRRAARTKSVKVVPSLSNNAPTERGDRPGANGELSDAEIRPVEAGQCNCLQRRKTRHCDATARLVSAIAVAPTTSATRSRI